MSLWTPTPEFGWQLSSVAGTRPTTTWGTAITPAQNAKGNWAAVIAAASVVNDVWGVYVLFHSNNVAVAARDTIVDIGYDPAGGTSYGVVIPDLLASCAAGLSAPGAGLAYYFPVRIPAGSAIAARASINNATVGTLRCIIKLFGLPKFPHLTRVGAYVTAFGITAASSCGTPVTVGTTADGPWAALGTPTTEHWYWQLGFGVSDNSMTSGGIYTNDLAFGDATNKHLILEDFLAIVSGSSEAIITQMAQPSSPYRTVPASVAVYGRSQCSGAADTNISLAAYGVGG
jgi:hypothetical protein